MLQKSRMLQVQGAKGEAVVTYCESLATLEMWYHQLSHRVNNMAVFTIFRMSLGMISGKPVKKGETVVRCSLLTNFAMLFMQLWGKRVAQLFLFFINHETHDNEQY